MVSLAMWFSIFYFCLALFRCLTTQEVKKQLQLAAPKMHRAPYPKNVQGQQGERQLFQEMQFFPHMELR